MSESRPQKHLADIVVILLVVFVAPCVMMIGFIAARARRAKVVAGKAATYDILREEAELRFLADALPAGSRDIYYWVQPYGRTADAAFRISETGFLAWAKRHGWEVRRIRGTAEARIVRTYDPAAKALTYTRIERGYYYQYFAGKRRSRDNPLHFYYDWAIEVAYDSDRGIAYYSFTTPD